jgi:Right handed beta helix region
MSAGVLAVWGLTYAYSPRPAPSGDPVTPRAETAGDSDIVYASPGNYLALLRQLRPGETLLLEPGSYVSTQKGSGLPIFDLHGSPEKPIMIAGPETGPRPTFYANESHNTIRIRNASYVTIRNLDLDGRGLPVDGVKAEDVSDHITIENLCIRNYGNNQQTVGISTKAPAWDWVIRGNMILGAGTGMYLGDSDGSKPFVHGVIEYNLISDTIGYNIEIKHQVSRPDLPGLPTTPGATIIRHNVFSKAKNASVGGMARPNLLVGHFPLSGPGAEDVYEIYGNFFYENPTGQPLFQGEGNLAVYDNLFWNDEGDAILIRPHNAFPRKVIVFQNTIVASGTGITVTGGSNDYRQRVIGNLVFASTPLLANDQLSNYASSLVRARSYLRHPDGPLGQLDLSPMPGKLAGTRLPQQLFAGFDDARLDFEGTKRTGASFGAYEPSQAGPRWLPALEIKPPPGLPSRASCPCPEQ